MKPRIEKAQVTLPTDGQVMVTRSFKAPRSLVYRAHTEPKLVQRWMLGPPGWTMPVCEMDVREGGSYRWRWQSNEKKKEFGFHGTFREVKPPERLRHSEFFDPGDVGGDMGQGAEITLELSEENGVTTITSLIDFGTKQARDAAMSTGMTDGMELSYQLLDRLVAES